MLKVASKINLSKKLPLIIKPLLRYSSTSTVQISQRSKQKLQYNPSSFNISGLKIISSTKEQYQFKPPENKEDGIIYSPYQTPLTYFPLRQKAARPPPVLTRYRQKDIQYSAQKLNTCCRLIRKKLYEQAITSLDKLNKKGVKILLDVLYQVKKVIQRKGGSVNTVVIREAFVGKGYGSSKIEFKGRGKIGWLTKPKSSVTLVCQELPLDELYVQTYIGKAPHSHTEAVKQVLFKRNRGFEEFRKYIHVISRIGKRERALKFERTVRKSQRILKEQGINVSLRLIKKKMIERQRSRFIKDVEEQRNKDLQEAKSQRYLNFEKNYKKKL